MRSLPILMSGLLLGLFGVLGAGLVGMSHEATAERIARNEREALLHQLHVLVPEDQIDNDILSDVIRISDPELLGTESTLVYRGRRADQAIAAVYSPVVTQGYSGSIQLIIAVRVDGTLAGVRVLSHRETPGLGDKVEVERSPWVLDFDGKSLLNPVTNEWKVRRDGGVFDQFTGATITPRAVVRGVHATLLHFAKHKPRLFEIGTPPAEKHDG